MIESFIKGRPYLYLLRDKDQREYICYVTIFLENWKLVGEPIVRSKSEKVSKHDNPFRTIRNVDFHYYSPNTTRRVIELTFDQDKFTGWATYRIPINFDDLHDNTPLDPTNESFCTDMIHVLVNFNNGTIDHDGSSTGHLGDADGQQ